MKVILKNVRHAFPRFWEPKEYTPGDGRARYDFTPLIEPGSDNDKAIEAAILAVATEAWGVKAAAKIKEFRPVKQQFAYRDGDTVENDGYTGMKFLGAHRRAADGPPTILNSDKTPLTEASGKPYGGCYVNASVDIYAVTKTNPGIFASFSVVQFAKDGDAFSAAAVRNTDDFEALDSGSAAEDLL